MTRVTAQHFKGCLSGQECSAYEAAETGVSAVKLRYRRTEIESSRAGLRG